MSKGKETWNSTVRFGNCQFFGTHVIVICLFDCISLTGEPPSVVASSLSLPQPLKVKVSQLWCHGLYSPWNSPGQNTGVGSCSLLQGVFPTQGLNPGLPHCRWILYQLSHQGSPRILEWVAYLFSSGSSWPRNWTGISCIVGGFFTSWVTREHPALVVSKWPACWGPSKPLLSEYRMS